MPSASVRDNKFSFVYHIIHSLLCINILIRIFFLLVVCSGLFYNSLLLLLFLLFFQLYSIRFLFILLYTNFDTVIFIIEFHFIFNRLVHAHLGHMVMNEREKERVNILYCQGYSFLVFFFFFPHSLP